jgi:hypothetical protein
MHVNEIPTVLGQEYYSNRKPNLEIADELKKGFEENYQPTQENAIRNALIKAAVKVGLVVALPRNRYTAIALGAGPIAEVLQKPIEKIKCPAIDTELFHAMVMMPTCQESKDTILAGLKAVQVPSKLLNETTEEISRYLIRGADRAGLTEDNIKYIAAVAHRVITKAAPATAKRIYKEWIESPLAEVKGRHKKALLNAEEQKKFNEKIMSFLAAEGSVAKSRFRRIESEFGQVFENQKEVLSNLKEAQTFFEAHKNQQIKRIQEAEYQHKIQQWSSIFSNLSQAGTQLKMPVLSDIAALGNIGLSATTAFSALSLLEGPALSLDFAVPCFTLASAVISAISLFCRDDDDNSDQFNQMMVQYFTAISQQITTLRHEMHTRFDEVDKKLAAIHSTLEKGITVLRKDIKDFAVPTLTSLQDIRSSIFSLYRTLNFKLDETLLHDFEEVIDKIDNYVQRIQNNALNEKEYAETLRLLEKVILKQSPSPTFNGTLYTDMSPQGINRLLMTKQVGHILGFLGLYAQEVLSIRDPKVDVYHLCNPHIWSTCVSRYLRFRKMFPEHSYDEQGLKMQEILNAGKDLLNYFNFISSRQDIITSAFAGYKDSVKKLKEFCHLEAHHYAKQNIGMDSYYISILSEKDTLGPGIFLWFRKEFAKSLLEPTQNALTVQFNTLLEDVESKYKLLLALTELTGRKEEMQAPFAKLMNKEKIWEEIQQYSQSASNSDPFILKRFVEQSEALAKVIAVKANKKATDPNFIQQVKKQYVKLSNFAELFLQQRALLEAMGHQNKIGEQPVPSTKDEDDSDVEEAPSKEAMNRSAKKIKNLKQNIVELKEDVSEMRKAMAILQNQNQQILQFLQASSRPPKT